MNGFTAPELHYPLAMNSIVTLDNLWMGRPRSIAAALLESDGHRAVIDPGPGSTLETLRGHLRSRDIGVGDLDAILLTHIHLDHAGATGALVRENPRLEVYVHSKGAPHMIDPSKLLASAARLWPDELQTLFGETLPVPAENLRILEGSETLNLGARKLEVVYTPGHASHHVSYFDNIEGIAFVGDTTGIRIEGQAYVMPATPPPDIDLGIWDSSFAALLARKPSRLFLTHFGFSDNPSDGSNGFFHVRHVCRDLSASPRRRSRPLRLQRWPEPLLSRPREVSPQTCRGRLVRLVGQFSVVSSQSNIVAGEVNGRRRDRSCRRRKNFDAPGWAGEELS